MTLEVKSCKSSGSFGEADMDLACLWGDALAASCDWDNDNKLLTMYKPKSSDVPADTDMVIKITTKNSQYFGMRFPDDEDTCILELTTYVDGSTEKEKDYLTIRIAKNQLKQLRVVPFTRDKDYDTTFYIEAESTANVDEFWIEFGESFENDLGPGGIEDSAQYPCVTESGSLCTLYHGDNSLNPPFYPKIRVAGFASDWLKVYLPGIMINGLQPGWVRVYTTVSSTDSRTLEVINREIIDVATVEFAVYALDSTIVEDD
eukprot:CAMPEP_0201282680 /NCGR_PEP_ID=MMETSP1317-20130820/6350_1 /ASSEMBLY_ACC=CAM_ASM_000770 /TAXON_ID=187299 /ORGANISM="Undescribed Undescribed, Strain Undescribed" /LENGTH=259 /DNA_ID=CAMNT_0047596195 /DNA_START=4073 /DNA_END=4852 /DNA_ORIENTATION=+